MGKFLAKESSIKADIVIPVPDSGVPAALGYAEESKSLLGLGLLEIIMLEERSLSLLKK